MKRLLLVVPLVAACSAAPTAPKIVSLKATPASIEAGQRATLAWEIEGAFDTLSLDHEIGVVTGTSVQLPPANATAIYTLTATNQGHSSTATVTVTVRESAAALIATLPSQATVGTPVTFVLRANDAAGQTLRTYAGTVHFTSTDETAELPADFTFSLDDDGTHSFPITFNAAGSKSVTASTVGGARALSVTATASVAAPVLGGFAFSGLAASALEGAAVPFTVTAQNPLGATLGGYRGRVTFTSSDPAAVLPAPYDFVAADHGVHTFSATFNTSGSQTLQAKDGVVAATSAAVTVASAPAGTELVYTDPPAGGKVRVVRNATSTSTALVLDVVANTTLTAYSAMLNVPLSSTRVTLGTISQGNSLNPGSGPAAMAAALPATGARTALLVSGLSQKAAGTGAVVSDSAVAAGSVLYKLSFSLKSGAPVGLVFDGAGSRASVRNKAGAELAGVSDFAIGKLEVR